MKWANTRDLSANRFRVPCPRLCVGMIAQAANMPTLSRGHGTQKFPIPLAISILLLIADPAFSQKKPEPKDKPQLTLAIPFVIPPGKPSKLIVRGLKLDSVTEVRCHEPKSSAKLLGKPAKANLPDAKMLAHLGDMQIEIEVTIPPETSANDISLSLIGPGGESNLLRLRVDDGQPAVAEKEPNNGFKQAQPLTLPVAVDGAIQSAQDVDVFRIDGKVGQRLVCEALAGRYGSPLDPILTLFDEHGQVLAVSDETDRANNVRLTMTLRRTGTYYLSIADANDQGGAHYRYRLMCHEQIALMSPL